jgi:hypothetical protein
MVDKYDSPSPERVARRAFVLAALACRSAIEGDADNSEAEAFRGQVVEWLTQAGIASELEEGERLVLEAPLGTLTRCQGIDGSWRAEGLVVLAWVLEKWGLPSYDELSNPADIADALGFMAQEGFSLLEAPRLRDGSEIQAFANRILMIHWRLRQFQADRRSIEFEELVKSPGCPFPDVQGIRYVNKDLAIGNVALSEAHEQEWAEVMSIVVERHRAVNWLLGNAPTYSEVSCDT